MLKIFGKAAYSGLAFLAKGKLLNKKEGAEFLGSSEEFVGKTR